MSDGDEERRYSVYKLTTPSRKAYIGMTCQTPEQRWQNGYGYNKNRHFWNAIQLYHWDNIRREVLFAGLTRKEAERIEAALIKYYKSDDPRYGYNNCPGAGMVSQYTIQRASESLGKRWDDPEYKQRMIKNSKTRWANPNFRERMLDIRAKPEVRARLSKSSKKKWENPEYRMKMANVRQKLFKNTDIKMRISKSVKKAMENPELRKILSERSREAWADPDIRTKYLDSLKMARNNPEFKKKWLESVTSPEKKERQSISMKKLWTDHPEIFSRSSEARRKAVICIETGIIYKSATEAARCTRASNANICACCKHYPQKNTAGGYHWEYYTPDAQQQEGA